MVNITILIHLLSLLTCLPEKYKFHGEKRPLLRLSSVLQRYIVVCTIFLHCTFFLENAMKV